MSTEKESPKDTGESVRVEKVSAVDYIADSEATVYKRVPRKVANGLYLLLTVIVVSFVWAYFAKLDESVMANGKIIPSAHLQAIQHLEGGIIKKILVKTGDKVKKGDVLMELDATRFTSEYKEGLAKLAVLQADIVRLTAKAQRKDKLVFDPTFAAENPVQVAEAKEYFNQDKREIDEHLELMNKQYDLLKKEKNIIQPLAKQGVVSDVELLRLNRQLVSLSQAIEEKKSNERDEARQELDKAQGEYAVLSETIAESKDRMDRTIIRSPVTGIVNQVYNTTVGSVAKPGETLIDIVPMDDALAVQAYIRPSDIGFIHEGQKAVVKVSAYDYSVYGDLEAAVETVGADAVKDKSGNSFYEVNLRTDESYLNAKGKKLLLIPGMTVTVNILTGEKTILDYILKPFVKAKESALQER